MPRTKKTVSVESAIFEENKAVKTRKPYPTHEERVALVDAKIAQLTALNEKRKALIEHSENTLNQRRDALAKSEKALEDALTRKERLMDLVNRPSKPASARVEKAKLDALRTVLDAAGKSIDDVIAEYKQD